MKASETVGKVLKKGDIVIYESTVYPGVTEEECVPILEKVSGLTFNKDFFAGYSPERINPGDKEHTVTKIKKITSGSTPEIGKIVNEIYGSIIADIKATANASYLGIAADKRSVQYYLKKIGISANDGVFNDGMV